MSHYAHVSEHTRSAGAGNKPVEKPSDHPRSFKPQILTSEHLQVEKTFKVSTSKVPNGHVSLGTHSNCSIYSNLANYPKIVVSPI